MLSKTEALYEHSLTKRNRVCRFVSKDELTGKTGYRSVYGFDDLVTAYFAEVGTTRGSRQICTKVFADELLIDFDDGVKGYNAAEEAEKFWDWLTSRGIGFALYSSGGRSMHFHVSHQPEWSKHMPYSHKAFMRSIGVKSDESIFQVGRLFRLPGTIHETTFKRKELIQEVEGSLLSLPVVEEPVHEKANFVLDNEDGMAVLLGQVGKAIAIPIRDGERNRRLFSMAVSLLCAGFSSEFVEELLEKTEEEFEDRLEDVREIKAVLQSAVTAARGQG